MKNSKGEVLLTALRRGFAAAAEAQQSQGAATLQQKAVIFTESRRTQEYLFRVLEQTEFAGKVMLFNGTNTDRHLRQSTNVARKCRNRPDIGFSQRRYARRTSRELPRSRLDPDRHRGRSRRHQPPVLQSRGQL